MPLPSVLDELDRLFDELVRRPWGAASRQLVPAEFREVEDRWVVELPVEGMRAADLRVDVQGRRLTVTGHRRRTHAQRGGAALWTRTQQETMLHRTLTLPHDADPDDIEAKIEGDTLFIYIRKNRKRQP
ncbi:MAG: Hsp20/alpha crystallin family protein [Candidatus Binatia bacterium]